MERHADGREIVEVSDRAAWRRWLSERHLQRDAIWLVLHKKTSDGTSPSYEEAVEEALCFGWIDSTVNRLDERRSLQLFAPRRPRSTWSTSNKERVARLESEGLLAPAGVAAVEVAKANGSWTALDAVERLEEPPELAAALDADASAREHWNGFSASSRKAILWWVASAKRPETRAKRIEQTARMAAKGLRAQLDRE
ncbi:MAG TPA: YdeI/OmpD-associated family protein [Gaiellaceae bacterium]|nr:YdeI/OmpD-associated family protein [Gaiellaceae bacterium]